VATFLVTYVDNCQKKKGSIHVFRASGGGCQKQMHDWVLNCQGLAAAVSDHFLRLPIHMMMFRSVAVASTAVLRILA
jgi:hypothetical protein